LFLAFLAASRENAVVVDRSGYFFSASLGIITGLPLAAGEASGR
jgi:hypothetical protein